MVDLIWVDKGRVDGFVVEKVMGVNLCLLSKSGPTSVKS